MILKLPGLICISLDIVLVLPERKVKTLLPCMTLEVGIYNTGVAALANVTVAVPDTN